MTSEQMSYVPEYSVSHCSSAGGPLREHMGTRSSGENDLIRSTGIYAP